MDRIVIRDTRKPYVTQLCDTPDGNRAGSYWLVAFGQDDEEHVGMYPLPEERTEIDVIEDQPKRVVSYESFSADFACGLVPEEELPVVRKSIRAGWIPPEDKGTAPCCLPGGGWAELTYRQIVGMMKAWDVPGVHADGRLYVLSGDKLVTRVMDRTDQA